MPQVHRPGTKKLFVTCVKLFPSILTTDISLVKGAENKVVT